MEWNSGMMEWWNGKPLHLHMRIPLIDAGQFSVIHEHRDQMEMCNSSPITVLDSPLHTTNGGQGTTNDPILVDITPTHPDSLIKVVQ